MQQTSTTPVRISEEGTSVLEFGRKLDDDLDTAASYQLFRSSKIPILLPPPSGRNPQLAASLGSPILPDNPETFIVKSPQRSTEDLPSSANPLSLSDATPSANISTFVIYSPVSSISDTQYNESVAAAAVSIADIKLLQTEFSNGGGFISVHSPDEAAAWIEAHYNDKLLRTIRAQGLGGPIAAMLSPDVPALALFGSILDGWVLKAAKLLSDLSQFTVMIRPLTDDPLRIWSTEADPSGEPQSPEHKHTTDSSGMHEERSDGGSDESSEGGDYYEDGHEGDTTEDDTESETNDPSTGGGVFRLRGGAGSGDKYIPKHGPIHSLDTKLDLHQKCHIGHQNLGQVNLLCKIQFTVQSPFEDQHNNSHRWQAISNIQFRVIPEPGKILPDRSYTSIGFIVPADHCITDGKSVPAVGFIEPSKIVKTVQTKARELKFNAGLTPGMHTVGAISVTKGSTNSSSKEEQNDRVEPKWIADCWSLPQARSSYWQEEVAYRPYHDPAQNQPPLEVEFSMGINFEPPIIDSPISFIIRNQTVLWVSNKLLKAKFQGIIVLARFHVKDIETSETLMTRGPGEPPHKVDLEGNCLNAPAADTTPPTMPIKVLLSIGTPPERKEPSLFKRVSDKIHTALTRRQDAQPDSQILQLPMHEFKARGWDATLEEWRMPVCPSLDASLRSAARELTITAWELNVGQGHVDNDPKSKGKQRDPGPVTLDPGNDTEIAIKIEPAPEKLKSADNISVMGHGIPSFTSLGTPTQSIQSDTSAAGSSSTSTSWTSADTPGLSAPSGPSGSNKL
ncbi:hypothetical protein B0H13DRAFT_1974742 [Mycena leptocephala]|nr:hypothetical protein B0H13DRAFT_1974742 [Mycena leptocephala]